MALSLQKCAFFCAAREGLLPIGLAEGCRLKRDIAKDGCIRRADVEIPEGRLIDRLRDEQDAVFGLKPAETAPSTLP